jgi:hypothetical protein
MRQHDDTRDNASVVTQGFFAGVIALLAALGRQVDDVARLAGQHVDDLGRGVLQQGDDLGRGVLYGSDDLLRGADDVTQSWILPESRMTAPQNTPSVRHAMDVSDDPGGHVLCHLTREVGQDVLELAIDHDRGNE